MKKIDRSFTYYETLLDYNIFVFSVLKYKYKTVFITNDLSNHNYIGNIFAILLESACKFNILAWADFFKQLLLLATLT